MCIRDSFLLKGKARWLLAAIFGGMLAAFFAGSISGFLAGLVSYDAMAACMRRGLFGVR